MRLDLWLLSGSLIGMGTLEQQEASHGSLLIAASVNENLQIDVNGESLSASFLLLDSRVPYSIKPGKDWQLFAFINEKSHLTSLLRQKLNGKPYLLSKRNLDTDDWLSSFVVDSYQDFQVEEMLHRLMKGLLNIEAYPLDWNRDLHNTLELISWDKLKELTIADLAIAQGLTLKQLKEDFLRITGITLPEYIIHIRVSRAFQLMQRDMDPLKAFNEAGLPSFHSMEEFFNQNYGLDISLVLEEKPAIRFSVGDLDRFFGYCISSF